jgi:hypothetical protein
VCIRPALPKIIGQITIHSVGLFWEEAVEEFEEGIIPKEQT